MPHQCVRCNTFYEDGAKEILKGCSCGARLFFYIKKSKLDEAKKVLDASLTDNQKKQIERDVFDLIGDNNRTEPVVLDFESIRVSKPGKYELDLVKLFKDDPLIFKLEEGKYIIDVASSFEKYGKKK